MHAAPRSAPLWTAALAATLPSLLAYNVAPSPTFWNQALAFALWPAFVLALAPRLWTGYRLRGQGLWALLAATGGVLWCALGSWAWGSLPASLAWSAAAALAAALVMVLAGAGSREARGGDINAAGLADHGAGEAGVDAFAAFCWGWVAAGVFNVAIGAVQVFAPAWADGSWIAGSAFPGRAVGNLRQPNHLSSLLLWSAIAVVVLLQLGRLKPWLGRVLFAAFVFTVVLTASRTGLVSVVLLAVWGAVDRRLTRSVRGLLLAAPLLYAASWGLMAGWAQASSHAFGGAERLAETDISSSRFAIWRDTWALIVQQPWTGVGFGNFNLAWAMTPSPQRPTALFDHTHNLVLQLAVELGLPLTALLMGLFLWALWRGGRAAWAADGAPGAAQRGALVMVVMVGLHSLLEYPLWYAYFLLPAAWAWGFLCGGPAAATHAEASRAPAPPASPVLAACSLVLVTGAMLSLVDYARVAAIFDDHGREPLGQRIASGQRSVFFAHHADYAAVTSLPAEVVPPAAFDRATHFLLDTRLMTAWSQSLAAHGQIDAARHVADRLREFRKPDAASFFAPCSVAAQPEVASSAGSAASAAPFQCQAPARAVAWRELAAH